MHGARLMIRAPTENDFTKKASLILGRTTVMGICARGGLWGWLGRGDGLHARLLDRQPDDPHVGTASKWLRKRHRWHGLATSRDGDDFGKGRLRGWTSNGTCV